jgi:membrane fusion protein YbhG
VRAPAAAVVEVLDLRPGDLVQPNAIAARLLEADQLYVIVFVPETQIGQVRLGERAEVRVDAWPREFFDGKVEQIRQQAEFLPRNVQTREERVHQVIGVKIRVDNRDDKLSAGVSAEVRFAPGAKG